MCRSPSLLALKCKTSAMSSTSCWRLKMVITNQQKHIFNMWQYIVKCCNYNKFSCLIKYCIGIIVHFYILLYLLFKCNMFSLLCQTCFVISWISNFFCSISQQSWLWLPDQGPVPANATVYSHGDWRHINGITTNIPTKTWVFCLPALKNSNESCHLIFLIPWAVRFSKNITIFFNC